MATERQIEANRRNAGLSTGPRSEEGKARSRGNATRHGLAAGAEAEVAEARESEAFRARRAAWGAEFRPSGVAGEWALDRAVAASLRIERCERAVDELADSGARRARLAWDEDREVEAATLAGGLARSPSLVARKLAATYQGVRLLIEAWFGLAAGLTGEEPGWTEADCSKALDLLGVPADLRRGLTAIDDADGGDPLAHRRALVADELDRLEALRDGALAELDDHARQVAMRGDLALIGKESRLLLRYERDAWRHYRESLEELRNSAPAPATAPAPAAPTPIATPAPAPSTTPPDMAPDLVEIPRPCGIEDLEEIDLLGRPEFVTGRTQFGPAALPAAHAVGWGGGRRPRPGWRRNEPDLGRSGPWPTSPVGLPCRFCVAAGAGSTQVALTLRLDFAGFSMTFQPGASSATRASASSLTSPPKAFW